MAGATPMTPERKRAILNVWVENPTATYGEICKKANIGRATFYELRQQKPFMDEYHRLCQQKFDEAESLAMQKLIDLANEGNWQAVKYLLDGKGYKPEEKSKVSVEGAAAINLTIGGEDDADNQAICQAYLLQTKKRIKLQKRHLMGLKERQLIVAHLNLLLLIDLG